VRRIVVGVFLLSLLGVSVVSHRSATTAQVEGTLTPDKHPLVGSWRFDGSTPFLYTFFSDGAALGTNEEGMTYHGAWQPLDGGRATFVLERLVPSSGTMGESFQPTFEIGVDPDRIPLEDGFLQRIVPDLASSEQAGSPIP
jgi:hypothetical protein